MINSLKKVKFKEVVQINPTVKLYKGEEFCFVPMEDVESLKSIYYTEKVKKFEGGSSSKFINDDILFARITPCLQNRKITQIKIGKGEKGFGSTEFFIFRAKEKFINQTFLNYYVRTNSFVESAINSMVGASGRQRADKGYISNLEILIPKIETQKEIGQILLQYDNLIENNVKRIAILEQMAEQLYKEWFVRMRFPNHENTKFVKGIPEGWKLKTLQEIANILMGQSPKSEFYNDKQIGLPFHQGVGSYGDIFPIHDTYCSVSRRLAKEGDILFSVRAPVGRLNIADRKLIIGRGLSAINHKKGYNSFLWELLKYNFTKEDIIGNGAIFNAVGKNELLGFKIIYPSEDLVNQFENKAMLIHNQIKSLYEQINNLRKTRDLLLPRLISGKLKIESEISKVKTPVLSN